MYSTTLAPEPKTILDTETATNSPALTTVTRETLKRQFAQELSTLKDPNGWIDATKREGRVSQEYLDFYNTTPSYHYAILRSVYDANGEFLQRDLKYISDQWSVLRHRDLCTYDANKLEALGVPHHGEIKTAEGGTRDVTFSYALSELKQISFPK